MNNATFFASVRASLFDGRLAQTQVDGITAILEAWKASCLTDVRWLAYMFATAFHETAKTMQPVRETLAATDSQAIQILEKSWAAGRMPWVKTPYWRKDADGKSWLGRGLVQLTFKTNYDRLGKLTGVDLVGNPNLAMEMPIAVKILFEGMTKGASNRGDFTGVSLEDFFSAKKEDWVNARKIINGLDRAKDVAGYAKKFLAAIEAAR